MKSVIILMIETEQPEGLSARKLVVETAKHNVLSAYNAADGLALFQRFRNVDAVLVHALLLNAGHLVSEIRKISATVPIIVASPEGSVRFPDANYVVSSHNPQELITLLSSSFAGGQ